MRRPAARLGCRWGSDRTCPYNRRAVAESSRRLRMLTRVSRHVEHDHGLEPQPGGGWVLVLGSTIGGPAPWCERLDEVLEVLDAPGTIVPCDVQAVEGTAAEVLEVLARLQLSALRRGAGIQLRNPDDALVDLLELTGLTGLIPVEREAEEREQPGI